jgi:hypothetical protein
MEHFWPFGILWHCGILYCHSVYFVVI